MVSMVAAQVRVVRPPSIIFSPVLHDRRRCARSTAQRVIASYLKAHQSSVASPGEADLVACGSVKTTGEYGRHEDIVGGRGNAAKNDESNM